MSMINGSPARFSLIIEITETYTPYHISNDLYRFPQKKLFGWWCGPIAWSGMAAWGYWGFRSTSFKKHILLDISGYMLIRYDLLTTYDRNIVYLDGVDCD